MWNDETMRCDFCGDETFLTNEGYCPECGWDGEGDADPVMGILE